MKLERLNEEDVKFKGVDHYYNLKQLFNRDDVTYMYENKYKFGNSIGYVSALMKRLNPSSVENAYELYLRSGEEDTYLPPTKRGRSANELEKLAIEWMNEYGKGDIPLDKFYDALVLHAVVETYDGFKYEKMAKDMLDDCGFETDWSDDAADGKYFVDIIAKKDGVTYFIQVKPLSFFTASREHTRRDRVKAFNCMRQAKQDFGNIVYKYLIYDKYSGLWVVNENDGRCAFDYDALVAADGTFIGNKNRMIANETNNLFNKKKVEDGK